MYIGAIHLNFPKMIPYWKWFLEGTYNTIWLSLVTVVLGVTLGFIIVLLKKSKFKPFNWFANLYTSVIRGTPILLQLMIIVIALPSMGIKVPDLFGPNSAKWISCIIALAINSAAYVAEIIRSGLDSVDKGQVEAARSLGLSSKQAMRLVVIPQAVKTILPAIVNEFIMMIKETSLVSTLGLGDLMYQQKIINGATYSILEPYIIIAIIYLLLTIILTSVSSAVERALHKHD